MFQKSRNESFSINETPLKNKSPNILVAESLVSTPKRIAETPLRLQSSALPDSLIEVPPTETRVKRMAAIKANKYVDIVTRRLGKNTLELTLLYQFHFLEQVPKNGSTPKIFKTANKLQAKQSVLSTPVTKQVKTASLEETPVRHPSSKKNKGFQYRVIQSEYEVDLNSPSSINIAPASVTRFRYHDALSNGPTIVPESATRSKTRTAALSNPDSTPLKQQSSKSKTDSLFVVEEAKQVSEEPVNCAPPATPKVTIPVPQVEVEFVAPQSILRSSKRTRKPVEFSSAYPEQATPAAKKPNTNTSTIPAIQALKMTAPICTPLQPVTDEPIPPRSLSIAEQSNVPSIIVPGLASKNSEASSSNEEVYPKRTPIRLKTPSRIKASLPSLADHSKISLIEIQKSVTKESYLAAKATPKATATPKVEPWTSRFLKESVKPTPAVPLLVVKPVDTSKISGFAGSTSIPIANVPIVPKFPLNLANIASVTKSTNALEAVKVAESFKSAEASKVAEIAKLPETAKLTESVKSNEPSKPVEPFIKAETLKMVGKEPTPEESPLSRAKRIDMENKAREEKLKTLMADKTERLKKSIEEVQSPESEVEKQKRTEPIKPLPATMKPSMQSSKLPVKANVLPSPKIPSRLAEAFSGIDSELPSIDIGLVEEEKVVSKVLAGSSAIMTPKLPATPSQALLHKTAILNSASRKMNPVDTTLIKNIATPKFAPRPASSSPFLPEIPSE